MTVSDFAETLSHATFDHDRQILGNQKIVLK